MKKLGDFHDGCFEGFWVDDPLVHIFLKIDIHEKNSGIERFAIVADGVAAMGAHNIRKGHIILDVETKTHEELSSEDMGLLYDVREGEVGQEQCSKLLQKRASKNWQSWKSLLAMERRSSFWPDPLSYLIEEIGRGSTARA